MLLAENFDFRREIRRDNYKVVFETLTVKNERETYRIWKCLEQCRPVSRIESHSCFKQCRQWFLSKTCFAVPQILGTEIFKLVLLFESRFNCPIFLFPA